MTSASWVSCGQRVVWDMGRTLREPPYGLAEPLPIRVPAGSKHQNAVERSGPITRGRTAQLRDCRLRVLMDQCGWRNCATAVSASLWTNADDCLPVASLGRV